MRRYAGRIPIGVFAMLMLYGRWRCEMAWLSIELSRCPLTTSHLFSGRYSYALRAFFRALTRSRQAMRSEEHTSQLQSLMRISYSVFCLTKKQIENKYIYHQVTNHHIY